MLSVHYLTLSIANKVRIPFRKNSRNIETGQLICNASQLTGFYSIWCKLLLKGVSVEIVLLFYGNWFLSKLPIFQIVVLFFCSIET